MAQQTAMQILWDWIDANCHEDNFNINDARDMSLKLEKEQIINAHGKKINGGFRTNGDFFQEEITGEQYYKDTYNK